MQSISVTGASISPNKFLRGTCENFNWSLFSSATAAVVDAHPLINFLCRVLPNMQRTRREINRFENFPLVVSFVVEDGRMAHKIAL